MISNFSRGSKNFQFILQGQYNSDDKIKEQNKTKAPQKKSMGHSYFLTSM